MFQSDSAFSRFMTIAFDVLFTGVLWIVCCIPLITIGASTTAAYYTMAKSVRHKTGYVHREFFHSFRVNFKQSAIMSIIFFIAVVVLVLDMQYVWSNETKLNSALFIILAGMIFVILCITIVYCPLFSRFQKSNMEMLRMSALIAFKYLPVTIIMIALFTIGCIGIWLMPWAVFIIPGLYLYLLTYPMEYIMRKIMPVPEEGSEEAEKWYYQ